MKVVCGSGAYIEDDRGHSAVFNIVFALPGMRPVAAW